MRTAMSAGRENAGCHKHPTSGFHLTHEYKDTQRPQVYRLTTHQIIPTNKHMQSDVGDLLLLV
jgi:Leucine-rich repeat (LRR) protein